MTNLITIFVNNRVIVNLFVFAANKLCRYVRPSCAAHQRTSKSY